MLRLIFGIMTRNIDKYKFFVLRWVSNIPFQYFSLGNAQNVTESTPEIGHGNGGSYELQMCFSIIIVLIRINGALSCIQVIYTDQENLVISSKAPNYRLFQNAAPG